MLNAASVMVCVCASECVCSECACVKRRRAARSVGSATSELVSVLAPLERYNLGRSLPPFLPPPLQLHRRRPPERTRPRLPTLSAFSDAVRRSGNARALALSLARWLPPCLCLPACVVKEE